MNELALFAGAGGGILAGSLMGWRTICAVEINEYRRSVLCARQNDHSLPTFPIWDDVRTFDATAWRGRVDVVSGGFPCQAHSTAARGANNADDLWPEMRRIVAEASPRYVFAENTSALAIECAAEDLHFMGYKTQIIPLSAKDLGGDHLRQRYWLRAYADDEGELPSTVNAEVAVLPEFHRGVWLHLPDDSRAPDGVADRVERLEATGDGQIPVVAATAWRLMSQYSTAQRSGDAK